VPEWRWDHTPFAKDFFDPAYDAGFVLFAQLLDFGPKSNVGNRWLEII
jgi:hypothetical protein